MPVAVAGAGEGLWIQFGAVGFGRGGDDKQPDLTFEMRILDENGKPTRSKPFTVQVNKDVPADAALVPAQFFLSLNRSGKFTVELTAADKVGGEEGPADLPAPCRGREMTAGPFPAEPAAAPRRCEPLSFDTMQDILRRFLPPAAARGPRAAGRRGAGRRRQACSRAGEPADSHPSPLPRGRGEGMRGRPRRRWKSPFCAGRRRRFLRRRTHRAEGRRAPLRHARRCRSARNSITTVLARWKEGDKTVEQTAPGRSDRRRQRFALIF